MILVNPCPDPGYASGGIFELRKESTKISRISQEKMGRRRAMS
jgi:hypothetical protein